MLLNLKLGRRAEIEALGFVCHSGSGGAVIPLLGSPAFDQILAGSWTHIIYTRRALVRQFNTAHGSQTEFMFTSEQILLVEPHTIQQSEYSALRKVRSTSHAFSSNPVHSDCRWRSVMVNKSVHSHGELHQIHSERCRRHRRAVVAGQRVWIFPLDVPHPRRLVRTALERVNENPQVIVLLWTISGRRTRQILAHGGCPA